MTPQPYYQDDAVTLHLGDCIEVMAAMPAGSVDAIVTDPPYGLGFMGKAWDAHPPGLPWATECLRVLKPGGHLLTFGGTRTWHRLAVAVEDAGFELRDSIAWLYGSGFPKSLDVSKAIDKAARAERAITGVRPGAGNGSVVGLGTRRSMASEYDATTPATDAARQWEGWGTTLKPAFEPIIMGRKPLIGTVAANVQAHGTGALNIDATRLKTSDKLGGGGASTSVPEGWDRPNRHDADAVERHRLLTAEKVDKAEKYGRWPANVILDEATAAELDAQGGSVRASGASATYDDSGGASRFFYIAKAARHERPKLDGAGHPTVKPLTLMRWLIKLVTPPGGTVLEPFLGSGTTAEACIIEGFHCIGIERDPQYMALARKRLAKPIQPDMFGGAV